MATFPSVTSYTPIVTLNQPISQLAQGNDNRIWGATDGTVFAIGGSVATFSGGPSAPGCGASYDGSADVWFTPFSTPSLYKVTTAGVITSSTPSGNAYGLSSVLGPDGRIWKVTTNDNHVYAILLSGPTQTAYAVNATANGTSGTIVSDGTNLWVPQYQFTSGSPNVPYVSKVTTAGVVTTYALLTTGGGTYPSGACIGSDGRLWLAAVAGTLGVWAVTLSTGVSVWYTMPTGTGSAGANTLVLGSDGNVYAPDRSASGVVWQITPSGVWTEYTIAGAQSFSSGALTDNLGNMWLPGNASSGQAANVYRVSLRTAQIVMIL